jgi:lysophospholipase L1-like esterase
MKKYWKQIAAGLVVLVFGALGYGSLWLEARGNAEHWEPSIQAFEARDAHDPPAPGQIVFAGSSSIRKWKQLARDMAPLDVINRGFGGSHIAHVEHFAGRIIAPHAPRAVVLYAGGNDLSWGSKKTPASVFADFLRFVDSVRAQQPDLPIYFVSIKPSRLRWGGWPRAAEANSLIAAHAARSAGIHYIDVATPMLPADGGRPPASLFIFDELHLSDEGYALWTSIIRPVLMRDLYTGEG